nr:MAG TPA: hypothetical protein [Caudoviricetes sp.]
MGSSCGSLHLNLVTSLRLPPSSLFFALNIALLINMIYYSEYR